MTRKLLLIMNFIFLILFTEFSASSETITFSADSMTGSSKKDSDSTILTGRAAIKTESMEIQADKIELYGKDFRHIKASGNVRGTNTQSKLDFTCSSMNYDRTTKIVVLKNSVHLVDTENSVTADAEQIEYNQDTQIAIMQIAVTLIQKENTCTAAYAIYHKKEQKLNMSGNPQVIQGEDTFRAQEISLNLDTQEIILDGRVHGTVSTEEKEEKEEKENTDSEKKLEEKENKEIIKAEDKNDQ